MERRVGNYTTLAMTVHSYPPESDKAYSRRQAASDKPLKPKSIRSTCNYIFMRDERSGYTWAFIGTVRQGKLHFSDGRDQMTTGPGSKSRMTELELRATITRLTGS